METRPLGRTGLGVSAVGLGTWKTYDVHDSVQVQPVTDAAIAHRSTFFDSSPMYGQAERVLAATLGGRRSGMIVATKVWAPSGQEGRAQIRQALDWYGGVIELYQIHNLEAWSVHLPYLEELKAQGRIRAIGITHYLSSQFPQMAQIMASGRVDTIQVPYHPREREVERTLLPLAAERGLGVIVMSPLGTGALLQTSPPAEELAFLDAFGLRTWAQALLNWGLSDPRVSVTIPATRDVQHVIDNCTVGGARRFDAAARERVAALAAPRSRWPWRKRP
jgi:aryl-alcohol dehydrogenase-like predicted oxidoreductase